MTRAPHILERMTFELELGAGGRERVAIVQNRVSAFSAGGMHGVLTTSLAAVGGDENYLVVEKLELDVGTVSLHNLEEDLASGIARCLRDRLLRFSPARLDLLQQWTHASGESFTDNSLSGSPAIATESALLLAGESFASISGGLNAAVASALHGPGDWSQLMAAVRDNHALRGRLANEVSPELLRGLLQSMVPQRGGWMADFSAVLLTLHDRVPLVSAGHHAFQRAVWECILSEAVRCEPSSFSLRSFVDGVLELLSARYALRTPALAGEITRGLTQLSQPTPIVISLAGLLAESSASTHFNDSGALHHDVGREASKASSFKEHTQQRQPARKLDDLARFLEWGILPWAALRARRSAENQILDLMAAVPLEVTVLVRRLAETESVRKRIAGQFSETVVHHLLGMLDPVHAAWMIVCTRQLRRLHAQKPLVRMDNRAFAQRLWEISLEYLAEPNGAEFDAQSFLKYLLQKLAGGEKASYELLLADVALRRPDRSLRGRTLTETGPLSAVCSAMATLLDEDLLGVNHCAAEMPRFTIQQTARDSRRTPHAAEVHVDLTPAEQIERWLLDGVWETPVGPPQNTDLRHWLEAQNDTTWLQALRRCGAPMQVVDRIVTHLPFAFILRIARLLTGPNSELLCGFLSSLQASLQTTESYTAGTDGSQSEQHVKRCSLTHFLRRASHPGAESGNQPVAVEELARQTLLAVSLHCQISYERLLLAVQMETRGQPAVAELCRRLREALDRNFQQRSEKLIREQCHEQDQLTSTTLPSDASVVADAADVCIAGRELVLHYLRYGSFPHGAPAISFQDLQRTVDRFSDDQLLSIARSFLPWIASRQTVSQRIAVLLSSKSFLHFARCVLPSLGFVAELEGALTLVAERLSLPAEEMLAAGRNFLLRHASRHQAESRLGIYGADGVMKGGLARLAQRAGVSSERVLSEPMQVDGNQGPFASPPESQHTELRKEAAITPSAVDWLPTDHPQTAAVTGPEDSGESFSIPQESNDQESKNTEETYGDDGVMQGWLASVARCGKVSSERVLSELMQVAENQGALANSLAQLQRTELPNDAVLASAAVDWLPTDHPQSAAVTGREDSGDSSSLPQESNNKESTLHGLKHNGLSQDISKDHIDDRSAGELDALAHFLRTGSLPWWADALAQPSSRWFSALLGGQSARLLQTLRSVADNPGAVERLLRYIPRRELEGLIQQASPECGGFILLFIGTGAELAEHAGLTPSQRARAVGLHWQEALHFLLDNRAGGVSPVEFLRVVSCRVSQQLGVTTGRYASLLVQVARRHARADSGHRALEELLLPMANSAAPQAIEQQAGPDVRSESISLQSLIVRDGATESHAPRARHAVPKTIHESALAFPDESDRLGQLEYILRYGEPPPPVSEQGIPQFMDSIANEVLAKPGEYRQCLRKSACGEIERKRMARLFSPLLLSRLWPLLLPMEHAQATLCFDLLLAATACCAGGSRRERLRQTCIEDLLLSASQGQRWRAAAYLRSVLQRWAEEHCLRAVEIVERMRENLTRQPMELQAGMLPVLDRVEREMAIVPVSPGRSAAERRSKARPTRQPSKPARPLPAEEPFYIANAGAILLWPFLARYFQTLSLLPAKGGFRDEKDRSRAIHLVQYLTTGEIDAPEHELLLNKILCGAHPELPLEPILPVTETEEKLSIQLLHGLIGNWEKLRNTSIEGLRQSFLIREGRLLRKEGGEFWSLVVSTRGYDILLDSLPWRLSVIRLPWMQTVLHAKWR
jgi:Contractile injection system tape measure protein